MVQSMILIQAVMLSYQLSYTYSSQISNRRTHCIEWTRFLRDNVTNWINHFIDHVQTVTVTEVLVVFMEVVVSLYYTDCFCNEDHLL